MRVCVCLTPFLHRFFFLSSLLQLIARICLNSVTFSCCHHVQAYGMLPLETKTMPGLCRKFCSDWQLIIVGNPAGRWSLAMLSSRSVILSVYHPPFRDSWHSECSQPAVWDCSAEPPYAQLPHCVQKSPLDVSLCLVAAPSTPVLPPKPL